MQMRLGSTCKSDGRGSVAISWPVALLGLSSLQISLRGLALQGLLKGRGHSIIIQHKGQAILRAIGSLPCYALHRPHQPCSSAHNILFNICPRQPCHAVKRQLWLFLCRCACLVSTESTQQQLQPVRAPLPGTKLVEELRISVTAL